MAGVEGVSGKNQLKTLFDFLSRTDHSNKVIFVWDCDVNIQVHESNNTYPYILPQNPDNSIARKGIENIFPVNLFDSYKKTIDLSSIFSIIFCLDTDLMCIYNNYYTH